MSKRTSRRRRVNKEHLSSAVLISKMHKYLSHIKRKEYVVIFLASFAVFFALLIVFTSINFKKDLPRLNLSLYIHIPQKISLQAKSKSCFTCNLNMLSDPYMLSQQIFKTDKTIAIVDIRSQKEYVNGHIKTAINIPVYTSLDNIEGTERDENDIVNDFRKINNKKIVIYGSSSFSAMPMAVHDILSKKNIASVVLSIGWNEWYNFRNIWVPQGKWDTFDPNNYSVLGR